MGRFYEKDIAFLHTFTLLLLFYDYTLNGSEELWNAIESFGLGVQNDRPTICIKWAFHLSNVAFLSVYVPQAWYDFDNIFQLMVCCKYEPRTRSPILGESPIDIKRLSFSCDVWWALQSHASVFIPWTGIQPLFKLGEGDEIKQILHSREKFGGLTLTQRPPIHTVIFRLLIKNRGNHTERSCIFSE